jgi:sigma-B regulation protein RsbU (phosphoserine phosphatase)
LDQKTLKNFQNALSIHCNTLLKWLNEDSCSKDIPLGGKSIHEVDHILSDLKNALTRIEGGIFGSCEICGGEVEKERLEFDYTTHICLDHYTPEQIRALETDLELAGRVQKQLLPCCLPELPGIEIAVHAASARIVGGDYYDFFTSKDEHQGFVIADVMGKGLPASLLMSNLQASLRLLGPEYENPKHILARLNELFRNNLKLIRFISIFIGTIDTENKILNYSNAGHHPPILWHNTRKKIRMLFPTEPAIGLTKNLDFQSKTIRMASGDILLLYTDGLIESRSSDGEEFGESRLVEFVIKHSNKSVTEFLDELRLEVEKHARELHDDLSLMIIKIR